MNIKQTSSQYKE